MDLATFFRFVIALLFVIALIGALAWVARRYGFGSGLGMPGGRGRLRIVETATVDARRRLVLIQRDGVEHLVLLSPTRETVIETGIPAPTANTAADATAVGATAAGATAAGATAADATAADAR